METIWCGWWALNPVFHALQPLHNQGVDLCKMDTSMYDSFILFCNRIHHLPSQLSFFFVKSSSHNLCYFVGLNFLIAMCCKAGGNYLMCMVSSESNIACSLALTQTSCGPCKKRLQFGILHPTLINYVTLLAWNSYFPMWKTKMFKWKLFDVVDELWIQYCMHSKSVTAIHNLNCFQHP